MSRSSRRLLTIPVFVVFCALLGGFFGGRVKATSDNDGAVESNLKTLTRVYAAIEANYADPIDPEKAIYNGAIQGMIRTLDPHSNFVDPKAFALLREERHGRYYGVGMTVSARNGKVMVVLPFEGSPAFRAGLRPGDILLKVNGKSCEGLTTTDVADLLKGPRGTQATVEVSREGSAQPIVFYLVRDEIPRPSVDLAYQIRPGVGYMQITSFSETTGREAAEALKELDPKNLKGLILDLRGNRGGLVSEAVSVADMFLSKGQVIVSHRGRSSPEKVFRARNGNGGLEYPLVILVDRETASASEIVAGALQDHDRALVVGENTFGKGLVQNEYPLSENAGLLLTIARYYTPSGRLIQRKFTGLSIYDYYYYRNGHEQPGANGRVRQIKLTDSGRPVYGGGGITPDEKSEYPALSPFMRTLLYREAFFNFTKYYLGRHEAITRDFQVDDAVMTDFRAMLDRDKIKYTDQEIRDNQELIKLRVKQNMVQAVFGKSQGDKIARDKDPQVLRALELMPRAKQLADNAHRIVAQQMGAQQ